MEELEDRWVLALRDVPVVDVAFRGATVVNAAPPVVNAAPPGVPARPRVPDADVPVVGATPHQEPPALAVALADGTRIEVRGPWLLTRGSAAAPGAVALPPEDLRRRWVPPSRRRSCSPGAACGSCSARACT
ncbi:hypothetical protein [Streptomyces sp. NPDC086023]|uniref:hypothetical protein n=1 Tax=Streptomyces sp. NPDC086023 TaxID=3365746 RepID=UPI0037D5963E